MRGAGSYNESVFMAAKLEDFVPAEHPLRLIRGSINEALAMMDAQGDAEESSERGDPQGARSAATETYQMDRRGS